MKKTALAFCAITILAGGAAHAQSNPLAPPASTTVPVVSPVEDMRTHGPLTEELQDTDSLSDRDLSNIQEDALDPTLDPLDSRNDLDPQPTNGGTPIAPVNPEQPLLDSQSPTVERESHYRKTEVDVSNATVRDTSADGYEPALNYDTDGDGMLDTSILIGPVNPEVPLDQPTP